MPLAGKNSAIQLIFYRVCIMFFLCLAPFALWGQSTYTWTGGGGDNNWTTPANWDVGTNYPGFVTGDTAEFLSAANVVLDQDIADLALLIINTPNIVSMDLSGHNIGTDWLDLGASGAPYTPEPCTAIITGPGTITTGTIDTAQDFDNTVTLTNGAGIIIVNIAWFNQIAGTSTVFQGDGTSSIWLPANYPAVPLVVFDNITLHQGGNTYTISSSGSIAPGQNAVITVSGTFPVTTFRYSVDHINAGGALEAYTLSDQFGGNPTGPITVDTGVTAFSFASAADEFIFRVNFPAVISNSGDGIAVTVFLADGVTPLGTFSFIYDMANPVWIGGSGGNAWNVDANWSTGAQPAAGSAVTIPNVGTNYPRLTAPPANNPATITIQSGGILDCAGYNVTAGTSITNYGTVRLTGTETITSPVITSGPSSTVEYYGAGTVNASWSTTCRNLYINKTGGTLTFPSGITVNGNLTTGAAAYNIVFNGNASQTSNIAGTAVTFNNTGTLTLGNDAGDSITFANGLTATTPAVNIAGGVNTSGTAMSLGTAVLTAAADLDTGGGNIGIATLDGNFDVILASGTGTVTFSGAVGTTAIGDTIGPAISSTGTGLVHFQAGLGTNSGMDIDGPVRFSGADVILAAGDTATTLDGNVTIDGVSIQAGRNITFGGNVVLSTAGVSISTTANNGNIVFSSPVSGTQNLDVTTVGIGTVTINGDVTAGATLADALSIQSSHIILGANVDLDSRGAGDGNMYLAIDAITLSGISNRVYCGAGTFQLTTFTDGNNIQFSPNDDGVGGLFFDSDNIAGISAGAYVIGDVAHTGHIYISGTGGLSPDYNLSALNNGPVTMYGAYTAVNRNLSLDGSGNIITLGNGTLSLGAGTLDVDGPVTLAANVTVTATAPDPGGIIFTSTIDADNAATQARTLTLNPGADGVLSIGGAIGATQPLAGLTLVNTSGVIFANSVDTSDDGGFLTITDTDDAQTVAFTAGVAVGSGGLTAANNGNYNVSITGAVNTVAGTTTFANGGTVTIGDAGTDTFTALGGFTANTPSILYLAGTLHTDSAPIGIGSEIILTANAVMDSEQGNDGNGGNINLSGAASISGQGGDWNLNLDSSTTAAGGDGGAVSLGVLDNNGGNYVQNLVIATTGDAAGNDGTLTAAGQVAINDLLSLDIGSSDAVLTAAGTAVSSLRVNSANTVTIGNAANPEAGGLVFLDPVTMTGNLSVTTTGTITDNGEMTVAGAVLLVTRNNAGAAITIDGNAGLYSHQFGSLTLQTLNAAGSAAVNADIAVHESAATDLALVNTLGTLTVVSTGAITDSGELNTGAISVTSQGAVTLDDDGAPYMNRLGVLTASLTGAGNLTVYNNEALQLGDGTAGIAVANGSVFIQAGGAVTQGGAGTVVTTDSGAVARPVSISTTAGDITVSQNINAANDTVLTLYAAGSILHAGAVGTLTTGVNGIVALTSGAAGSIGVDLPDERLLTATSVLRIDAGSAGSVITEADAVQLGDITDGVSAAGTGLLITAGGAVTTGNAVAVTGGGFVDINSGAAFILADGLTLSSDTGNITIDSTGANDILINGDIATGGTGTITLTSGQNITMDATSSVQSGGGIVTLDADAVAAGSLVLDVVEAGAAGDIVLRSGSAGSITRADASNRIGAAGSTSILDINDAAPGNSVGAPGTPLITNVGTLRMRTTGDAYIDEADGIILGDGTRIVSSTGGIINIQAGGSMAVHEIHTTSDVTLTAVGEVYDNSADTVTDITADAVTITAGTGIGATAALEFAASSFDLDGGNGDVDVANAIDAAVTITNIVTVGSDIIFNQTGQATPGNVITITGNVTSGNGATPGGTITINNTTANPDSIVVAVTAAISSAIGTGGELILDNVILQSAPVLGAGTITLDGDTANTGTGSITIGVPLTFPVSTTLRARGDIIVQAEISTAAGNLVLEADSDDDGFGGVRVDTAGLLSPAVDLGLYGSDLVSPAGVPGAISLFNNLGSERIDAGGDVILQGKNEDVDISVLDGIIAGGSVTINSFRNVMANNADSDIESTGISITADFNSLDTGAITMADGTVFNSQGGTLSLSAYGDISLGQLITTNNTGAAVSVISQNGLISDINVAANNITATDSAAVVTLNAAVSIADLGGAANVLAGATDYLETNIRRLQLNGNAANIAINNIGGDLVITGAAPGGAGQGNLLVQNTGSITVNAWTLTNGAASDSIGLVSSAGSVTVPDTPIDIGSGYLRLVASAVGQSVNNTANLWTADTLVFRSGSNGVNQALTTRVNTVTAEMTGTSAGSGIGINENDGIGINSITTVNGPITLTASNAAAGDISVSTVTAGNASTVTLTNTANGGGDILDNTSDISGGILDISVTGTIGTAVTAIGTDVATLRATAGGDIYIDETNDIQLGDPTGIVTSSGGDVAITAAGDISTGLNAGDIISTTGTGDAVTLVTTAAGSMILSDTINAIGIVTLTNAGQLDVLANINAGGGVTQNGAGDVQIDAAITTTGGNVLFSRPVALVNTGSGAGTTQINTGPAGGDITFASTLDGTSGTETLDLTAGTGSIDFDNLVGNGTDLGTVTINSAQNVTADMAFNSVSISQTAGSGTTSFTGAVAVTGAAGIDLNGNNFTFSGTITTAPASGGPITITNSGLLSIADTVSLADWAGMDVSVDGAFTQDGTGGVSIAGDILSGGSISFSGDVILTGNVIFDSTGNAATGANIIFGDTVDAAASDTQELYLNAGTGGIIDFRNTVGGILPPLYIAITGAGGLTRTTFGEVAMPNVDLYLDHDGCTLTLGKDLSVRNLYFYRGTLNMAGRTVTTAQDFAVFGGGYDANDFERAGIIDFAYPAAAGLSYYPAAGTYDAATGVFSAATTSAFADLAASIINVSANFYNNGADMTAGGDWTLSIPDNASVTGLSTGNPFGDRYAFVANATLQNCQTGPAGYLNAAEAVDGGGSNERCQFSRPEISSAETLSDNVLRVEFTMPVENSNNEISAALAAIAPNNGGIWTGSGTLRFDQVFFDAGCTTLTDGQGDLSVLYFRTTLGTWNTDAAGTGPGAAISTDRAGVHQTLAADLTILKGVLLAANGKTMNPNYGLDAAGALNPANRYTGTTDNCRPVLVQVIAGREGHVSTAAMTPGDAHNYFDLRYSEPVTVGTLGPGTDAENIRSGTSLSLTAWDMRQSGADVIVDSLFSYPGTFESRSRDSIAPNSLARNTAYTGGNTHGVRVYVVGFTSGGVPPARFWPGYIVSITNPAGQTAVPIDDPDVYDAQSLEVDTSVTRVITAGAIPWDVQQPEFAIFQPGGVPSSVHELVVLDTNNSTFLNRVDIHVLDNPGTDQPGWDSSADHPENLGPPEPHGLRDSSFTGINGFYIGRITETPTAANISGLGTGVDNSLFNPSLPAITTSGDTYFSLTINEGVYSNQDEMHLSYNTDEGLVTDLAGNLLVSATTILCIERTPPGILYTLASVGDNKVYVRFSEPVFTTGGVNPVQANDFRVGPWIPTSVEILETMNGGARAVFLHLPGVIDADDAITATVNPDTNSVFDRVLNPMSDSLDHPLTDIGLGVAEPVWATDSLHTDPVNPDSRTPALFDFDGSGRMMDTDITLRASILASTTSLLSLVYDVDVPASMLSNGFWLPVYIRELTAERNNQARSLSPVFADGNQREFLIPSADPEIVPGKNLEFLLRLGNLYCARLLDPTDPRTLAPWVIPIRDIVRQTGGATILNNVINPGEGDEALLLYRLSKGGMVTITVFGLDGDVISVIHRGPQGAGEFTATWNGRNRGGRIVARGIYFIRIVAPGIDEYRKVMVVR